MTTAMLQNAAVGLCSKDAGMGLAVGFAFGYGGLVQLLVGMWEVRRNNVFGVVAFGSYGGFWLSLAAYEALTYGGVFTERDPGAVQAMLCAWGILTAALFVQTLRMNVALAVLFSSLALLFFFLAASINPARHTMVRY